LREGERELHRRLDLPQHAVLARDRDAPPAQRRPRQVGDEALLHELGANHRRLGEPLEDARQQLVGVDGRAKLRSSRKAGFIGRAASRQDLRRDELQLARLRVDRHLHRPALGEALAAGAVGDAVADLEPVLVLEQLGGGEHHLP
jgi:hypothetical protein